MGKTHPVKTLLYLGGWADWRGKLGNRGNSAIDGLGINTLRTEFQLKCHLFGICLVTNSVVPPGIQGRGMHELGAQQRHDAIYMHTALRRLWQW